jgi:hypothetical protein
MNERQLTIILADDDDGHAYITKPVAYEALVATIQRLCSFLEIGEIPGAGSNGRYHVPV